MIKHFIDIKIIWRGMKLTAPLGPLLSFFWITFVIKAPCCRTVALNFHVAPGPIT